ncbi:hypothetical protein Q9R34_19230 [Enterobacter sp. BRE11]|nr:hypothetical protein [Enterobacter sp. BRE11]
MSKVNWDEHRRAFVLQKAESGITVKEYCEYYGLPFNTARRELNGKALAAMRDQAGDHNHDHSGDHASDHQNDHGPHGDLIIRRNGRKTKHSAALEGVLEPRDDAAAQPGAGKKANAAHAKKIRNAGEQEAGRPQHTPKPRGEGKPFEEAHETKLVANRRGYPRPQDYEAALEVLGEGVEASAATALYDSLAHMQLLKRTTERAVALFEQEALNMANGKKKDDDDGGGGGPHPILKMTKLMIEVGYLVNDHATRVASIASGTDKNRRENEKHALTHNAADVISQAYALRDEHDWDLLQTAEYIEQRGIKLPESLAKRLDNELKNAEPSVDDSTQISEEELDREARQYRENKAGQEADVAERRRAVAELVDSGNYGDHTVTGERRDGESDVDYSNADIDFSATSDLYGEDLPDEIAVLPGDDD